MDEFKKFLKALAVVIAAGVTIAASVGSICYGMNDDSFYILTGVLNFGWLYFPIREIVRYFKARNAQKTSGKGGVAEPKAESKDNIYEQKH